MTGTVRRERPSRREHATGRIARPLILRCRIPPRRASTSTTSRNLLTTVIRRSSIDGNACGARDIESVGDSFTNTVRCVAARPA